MNKQRIDKSPGKRAVERDWRMQQRRTQMYDLLLEITTYHATYGNDDDRNVCICCRELDGDHTKECKIVAARALIAEIDNGN